MNWTKSKYRESQIDQVVHLSTLTFLWKMGKYNVYNMDNGNTAIVIFDDQRDLIEFVKKNSGSVFGIKFLIPANNKYKYTVHAPLGDVTVLTVARLAIVVPAYEEGDKKLVIAENGSVTIE